MTDDAPTPETITIKCNPPPVERWGKVEIMGHRQHWGRIIEVQQFGAPMLQIDVPERDGTFTPHLYPASALFGVHLTTEEVARKSAAYFWPREEQQSSLMQFPHHAPHWIVDGPVKEYGGDDPTD